MPTLSELAKTQQRTTVGPAQSSSAGNAGGTNIQPTQQIDKTAALTADIGKMFGGLLQEHQQASEYAGKTVGTDNLVEYKQTMGKINNIYAGKADLNSSDMSEKTRLEQGAYETYMQKGAFGDNDLANKAFRDTYAVPATDALLRAKGQNESNRVALFKSETKRDTSFSIGQIGDDITAENIATFKQQYVDAGLDPNAVDGLVLTSSANTLAIEMDTNHALYYDAGGNIREESVNALLGSTFRHYAGSENEAIQAEIIKNKKSAEAFLKTKANAAKSEYTNQAMNRGRTLTWDGQPYTDSNGITHKFANNFAEFERTIMEEFPLLTTENHTQAMNLYKTKTTSKNGMNSFATKYMADTKFNLIDKKFPSGQRIERQTVEDYSAWNATIQNMATQGLVSESKAISAEFRQKDIERQYNNQQTVFNDMGTQNTETLIAYSEKGSTNPNGETITGNEYMKQYKISEDNLAQSIDVVSIDTNVPKDAANLRLGLHRKFDESVKIANAQGKARPAIFNRYDAIMKDVSGSTQDIGSMQKMLEYVEYSKANGNNQYYAYDKELNVLKQTLYKTDDDGKLLPEDQRTQRGSIILQSMATDIYRNSNNKTAVTTAKKAVTDIAEAGGEGLKGTLTFITTPVPENTSQHIMKVYKGPLDDISVRQEVSSYEQYDVGTGIGFDKNRVFVPKGLTHTQFGSYIDTVLKLYNKNREDTLEDGNIEYVIGNDGVDLNYRLLDKTTQRHIGNITTDGYQFLKGTGEMSDVDTRTKDVFTRHKDSLFLGD